MSDTDDDKARAELLKGLKQAYPNQIPAKEIYQPDPVAKSMQGPLEVVHMTFATLRKGGHRA